MLLLLDTHAFLWWNNDDAALGPIARAAIADGENIVFVSAATAWEIATKRAAGKLDAPGDIAEWVRQDGFAEIAVEIDHAVLSAELPDHHRDPFDRLLVAQASIEELTLVTMDPEIMKYDVETLDART
ncbi:MAG TPA: type II toxin-antitoxin system VapC family toxin [Gaiellaceae bacterium]|nr:type II toxin-antitoxin system VapC family toxin [Gaiellaceae bacterium]